jgi:pimeloyl-[acyl-carrier protein] synthase
MTSATIDLNSPTFVSDPYPIYHQLQESEPAYWVPFSGSSGMWLITRYADVAALFKEAHFSNDMSRIAPPEQAMAFSKTLIFSDPPDHTRVRALVHQAFTPRRVKDLEPRISVIVDELLAQVRPHGAMDFVADFASVLPIIVIAELLGVPPGDRAQFQAWANMIARGSDNLRATYEDRQAYRDAGNQLGRYFQQLLAKRRRQPQDDLLTSLLDARDVQDRLSEEELLQTCSLLLLGGYETTARLLGSGLFTLLSHPDQLALLQQHPTLLPSAIEEMLRFESPVQQAILRITTAPVELAGQQFADGELLSAVIGAANRDPAQFPNPDQFDITRDPNRHLAFGFGIHFCLGAPLARLEARIAFGRLLAQLPALQLAQPAPDWSLNTRVRGLQSLAVTFTASG